MAKKSSTKRFGTRYGAKNRDKVAAAERQYKQKNKDPITGKIGGVKRLSSGVYLSTKTGVKFTGRAYSPGRTIKKGASQ